MLLAAVIVIAMYIAYRIGLHYGERCGEIRGYAQARTSGRVVEEALRQTLQAMVIRNETLVTVLRQYAPELFVPRIDPREAKSN